MSARHFGQRCGIDKGFCLMDNAIGVVQSKTVDNGGVWLYIADKKSRRATSLMRFSDSL